MTASPAGDVTRSSSAADCVAHVNEASEELPARSVAVTEATADASFGDRTKRHGGASSVEVPDAVTTETWATPERSTTLRSTTVGWLWRSRIDVDGDTSAMLGPVVSAATVNVRELVAVWPPLSVARATIVCAPALKR